MTDGHFELLNKFAAKNQAKLLDLALLWNRQNNSNMPKVKESKNARNIMFKILAFWYNDCRFASPLNCTYDYERNKFKIDRTILTCLNLLSELSVTDERVDPNYRKALLLIK